MIRRFSVEKMQKHSARNTADVLVETAQTVWEIQPELQRFVNKMALKHGAGGTINLRLGNHEFFEPEMEHKIVAEWRPR